MLDRVAEALAVEAEEVEEARVAEQLVAEQRNAATELIMIMTKQLTFPMISAALMQVIMMRQVLNQSAKIHLIMITIHLLTILMTMTALAFRIIVNWAEGQQGNGKR